MPDGSDGRDLFIICASLDLELELLLLLFYAALLIISLIILEF